MVGYRHNVKRYFTFDKEELLAVLVTAAFGGFIFSFNDWGGEVFDFMTGLFNLIVGMVVVFLLLSLQVLAQKLAGIRFGIHVHYDKYVLGLLLGLFITFLSFGVVPFFITGTLTYKVIPNLRIGKFRAALAKNWEVGLTALAGILASLMMVIPFHLLQLIFKAEIFHTLIVMAILLSIFTLIPLPLIQTANPYTVYMSRMEALEGNTPGFDLFFASPAWFFFVVGLIICFSLLTLTYGPSILGLFFSLLLGFGAMFGYMKARIYFNP